MRKIVLARILLGAMTLAAAGVASVAAPSAAQAGTWCVQGRDMGYPGDCSYSTYAQCQASASGRVAYCGINPRAAYRRQGPPRGGYGEPYGYNQPSYGYGYNQPYGYYR
jgi:Protein of unknown function (DUF3551)